MNGTVVYDGDCGLCAAAVRWLLARADKNTRATAWQDIDLQQLGLTQAQCERAAQWIAADGTRDSGHRALARALATAPGPWARTGRALLQPPLSIPAGFLYRAVAANRTRLPRSCTRPTRLPASPAPPENSRSGHATPPTTLDP